MYQIKKVKNTNLLGIHIEFQFIKNIKLFPMVD